MNDNFHTAQKLQVMQAIKALAQASDAPEGEWLRFSAEVCLEPTGEITMAGELLERVIALEENPTRREATFLERRMAQALNTVKAWHDSDGRAPFPVEVLTDVDALLSTYEARRVD